MADTQPPPNEPNIAPGTTISPGGASTSPQPVAPVVEPAPPAIEQPAEAFQTASASNDDESSITWTASEFIAHEKSGSWYGAVAGVALIGSLLVYVVTKDIISSVVIIVCAAAFGFYGSRQPRQMEYLLNEHGIGIGQKFYPYEDYRSFAIVQDGAFSSIIFKPLKRFATFVTIYYSPDDEDQIVELLSDRLPFEDHSPDPIDRLMRRIRF